MRKSLTEIIGRTARTFAVGLLCTLATAATAEPYRLAPGDRVLVQIIELNNHSYVGTVDTAGQIRLPYLGTHLAANKTLDELSQDISLAVAGQQIRSVQNGISSVIVLDEQDIFLDIDTYRPVTVVGAVAAPGRVPFEPGLNVRAAIGSAGGNALAGQTERVDQLANFRTRQAELRETEAWLAAELWRIDVLLSGADSDTPIGEEYRIVEDRLDSRDVENFRRMIDGARAQLDREREDNAARIVLTKKRTEFLETALAQFQTASEIEEERLQDVLQLSNRGLTTVNSLDNAREGALNASSRLLTTQADLAAAESELQSLMIEKQGLDADFVQALMDEKAKFERDYDEARARLTSLNRELALGTFTAEQDDSTELQYILHRQDGASETSTEVTPDTLLRPGDVVEVIFTYN
ncbi:polysaccharide biosynthesis protein [Roseobacter denitrificans]|uniref:Polysaccharide biosynthesis/export protein, putative n=1 Tax=Roseobacter denitrificans (strain ATCC 33942 / OCh 114) TaxID=375451 RepID=Q161N9_ROSDO|nr:polysaccharide biosynthesis/export family protein [Roseobacter denitrificans]ABG33304.1 polysaccharide biosynthesis/export protein, putative [Roseobacter denitrificans OCh 114]AVL52640.1 polysaccharide biosynthesis protein [Roseobacter denitrificans]SFG22487.1 polysaccharide export outer membrane protein [Roseobacter denitrificans OCh 114]